MLQHLTPSIFIFEESTYTTLPETVIADTLDVWILDSAAGNRNRPQIRLLPMSECNIQMSICILPNEEGRKLVYYHIEYIKKIASREREAKGLRVKVQEHSDPRSEF